MTTREFLLMLLSAVALTSLTASLVLLVKAREHRIDISRYETMFNGASRIWQVNVFSFTNYEPAGRRLVRWAIAAVLCWWLSIITMFVLASITA